MEILFGLTIGVFITAILGFILFRRFLDRIAYLEEIFGTMYEEFGTFTAVCEQVLNKPMFSNEPIIMLLMEHMKRLHKYLIKVEEFYTFDLELNENNVELMEKEDGA